jgi:hypothetical protein
MAFTACQQCRLVSGELINPITPYDLGAPPPLVSRDIGLRSLLSMPREYRGPTISAWTPDWDPNRGIPGIKLQYAAIRSALIPSVAVWLGASSSLALSLSPALSSVEGAVHLYHGRYAEARGAFASAALEALLNRGSLKLELPATAAGEHAAWAAARARELQAQVPPSLRGRLTRAAGAFEDPITGRILNVIGSNQRRGVLPEFISLKPGELVAGGGFGHAERQLLLWGARKGLRPIAIGASNRHCLVCADLNIHMDGINASPVRHPGVSFDD